MYLSILLPSIFALGALYKKKLTVSAIIIAWIMGVIITYCGKIPAFIALALTFILTILTDKLKNKKDDEQRNAYQIISNVLTPCLCTILYFIKNADLFIIMYYAVITSSLADTFASSIGSLSNKSPRHPITFKKITKGESGAVSFLGLSASALAGLIIGAVYYISYNNITNYLLIIIMGILGSYIDSLLGALCQGKYQCTVCHKYCENPTHCNKETKLIKGLRIMNNNMVNLLNNISVFLLTYLILK
jgi:uncharacterized protein (TIGR00297 family)